MPKPKPNPITCPRCNKIALPRRGYCNNCYVYLLRHGIIKPLPKPILPDQLSVYQEQVLSGSLLGDGCIYHHKASYYPYFFVQRQLLDKEYLIWQAENFKPYTCNIAEGSYLDKRTGKTYYNIMFRTFSHPIFQKYKELWYPNNIKIIPKNLDLNPLTLAVWFLDDGYVRCPHSKHRFSLKLSTHGFTIDDVEWLASKLTTKYKEYFGVTIEKQKLPIINASDSGTRLFLMDIDKCIPPGMDRKIKWRNMENRFYENIPEKSHNRRIIR